MQKNKKEIALFGSVKILVFASLLCAISGVMKLIAPSGDTWRISLENFPIIFAGITLGPITGGAVGITSDLLGCVLRGYAINPFITLSSMAVGIVSGIVYKISPKAKILSIILSVYLAHIVSNVFIKTFVLSKMYGMPLDVIFVERVVTYSVTALVESLILVVLLKNKAIKNGIKRVTGNEL